MRVLFVCLGNICRSPTAEGVMRHRLQQAGLAAQVAVDSAGTAAWHIGKAPDPRTCAAAAQRGYRLHELRARQVQAEDFARFDLILAMDHDNLRELQRLRPDSAGAELDLLLRRGGLAEHEVPDPYYGGSDGFERVLDLVESACERLIEQIRERL
ncbi:low molecular weight protein-tyrosine-phosphatase [Geopseudomonas guangdongensis]|uniref:protein-tyrosine-phosphatase n=1 Tax=Geopseudomonas guangdongensis TaxID=1245526 RepID=A0A1H2H240_9GAMM|nr:low molecular weight protein-tyrosine-phosphatase [Pseudomonas guangdongensis]SDU25886.1 protein tyrosine phosphatase [Pseudomonas guangdongensis]